MIPLTSLKELDKLDVPAKLEPMVPGKWTWKGTQTLQVIFFQKHNNLISPFFISQSLKHLIDSQKVPIIKFR